MCGLVYAKRKDKRPVSQTILKRYNNQKGRGSEGFGYLSIQNGVVVAVRRSRTEGKIEEFLKDDPSEEILFHHRFPTSTPNIVETTHPIEVKNKSLKHNYYVIHNGVLLNEDNLKPIHEALGFVYNTYVERRTIVYLGKQKKSEEIVSYFNDSESLAIELALYFDGKKKTIDTEGSVAFICVQTDKKDKVLNIHYGRNSGNPLILERNKDLFVIKSEGHGYRLPENKIISVAYKTGDITENDVDIGKYNLLSWGKKLVKGEKRVEGRKEEDFGGTGTATSDTESQRVGFVGKEYDLEKYMVSRNRLDDIEDEHVSLSADVHEAEDELRTAEDSNDEEQIKFFIMYLEETKKKKKEVEEEISWLEVHLEKTEDS